jgi:GAF domain-containing protein
VAEVRQAERVQSALYRIADLASAAEDMQAFYRAVHAVVGELMDASNFYIALYEEARQLINYPYYVDSVDVDVPDPNQWDVFGTGEASGTTAYVLRTGEPELLDYARTRRLIDEGEIKPLGVISEDSSWLGVPLKAEGQTVGVLAVQSYTKGAGYSREDKELLAFVGQHVGTALSRARAIEETRQRNAELALINGVQEALAGELDLQAIYETVGDRIRDVFDAQVVDIGIYDEAVGLVRFPYTIERGVRFPDEPIELIGFRKHVIETREPLLIDEGADEAAASYGNPGTLIGEAAKSMVYVPLVVGTRATGVVSLQNLDREHAFTDSDVRLLQTLCRSLSVALENARLVHETRQRNAELALINSVQAALAGELELQAIYDVVGDKIQEIFDAQVVDIGIFDFDAGVTRYPYAIERGVRFPDEPVPLDTATTRALLERKSPIRIDDFHAWVQERGESGHIVQGEPALSILIAPLVTGDEVRGRISLQNLDRKHAFSEDDLRLLTTLASSLSVALENARLVHETRQRNAELALINSVQESIAGELDQQAIYDVVGEKLREVFDAQVVDIGVHDEAEGIVRFVYQIERGVHFPNVAFPVVGFRKHVLETRRPLAILEDMDAALVEYGNPVAVVGEPSHGSALFQPLVVGGRATGVISIQNLDRERAFSDSDQRLLSTIAGSLGVALENAQLVHETRQRNAELALINSVQEAIAGELDPQAIYDLVGDRIRDVFDAQVVSISTWNEATGLLQFPYVIERDERLEEQPIPLIGFRKHVIETREPLMIDDVTAEICDRYGNPYVLSGEVVRSALFVPLLVGGHATGVVSLQNVDRTYAFTEADQRLLVTLATSVSVALDNARLVHETRRRAE